jgi:hypothetical protein
VLIDFPADSGVAETYKPDESKMAGSPKKEAMPMLWYWETRSIIQMQRPNRWDSGEHAPERQFIKHWLE